MQPTVKLVTSGPGSGAIMAGVATLQKSAVYVGIPEKTAGRKKGTVTNAQLAFLLTNGVRDSSRRRIVMAKMQKHNIDYNTATRMYLRSHGSPLMQTPPRPIIEPALEAKDNQKAITAELQKAAEAALDGKGEGEVKKCMALAGMQGQNRVRAWFTDPRNNWPPNAPSTIRRKGSANPNIDTGQLRKAITYVVT